MCLVGERVVFLDGSAVVGSVVGVRDGQREGEVEGLQMTTAPSKAQWMGSPRVFSRESMLTAEGVLDGARDDVAEGRDVG